MGRESIEIHIQTITGEKRDAAWGQHLSQRMDEQMRNALCARTQMEHRNNLRTGIDGQPEPEDLFGTAQSGAEFVQLEVLEMLELKVAERVLVQRLSVLKSASEPRRDGGLAVAEYPFGRGSIQPLG